jgi:hypothetical protein
MSQHPRPRRNYAAFDVFAEDANETISNVSPAHRHAKVRGSVGFPADFVLDCLGHTICTRFDVGWTYHSRTDTLFCPAKRSMMGR